MNGGGVGGGRVGGEGAVDCEVEKAEDQVRVVAELKGDLRELRRGEAVVFGGGDERAEVGPPGFRAVVLQNGGGGGDYIVTGIKMWG